jgi:hypothetical protein
MSPHYKTKPLCKITYKLLTNAAKFIDLYMSVTENIKTASMETKPKINFKVKPSTKPIRYFCLSVSHLKTLKLKYTTG